MCWGELQCSKGGKQRVREMCKENGSVQKVPHVCEKCAGENYSAQKVVKTCAINVRGRVAVFKTVAKHVCEKSAGEVCSVQLVTRHVWKKGAGDTCSAQKVATICAGNVRGQTWRNTHFPIGSSSRSRPRLFLAIMPAIAILAQDAWDRSGPPSLTRRRLRAKLRPC